MTQDIEDTKTFTESKTSFGYQDDLIWLLRREGEYVWGEDYYHPNEHKKVLLTCQHVELLKYLIKCQLPQKKKNF